MILGIHSKKLKRSRRVLISAFLVSVLPERMLAQCAMCRAVVEQGGEEIAEGINSGIVYLMAFPYIVVAVASYLLYRNWKRTSSAD